MSVLLTVRATLAARTLEAARVLHNDTAGSAPGIAAARALGDLSHSVYAPAKGASSSAKDGELLFLDHWVTPDGIMQFFGKPTVQEQAAKLFSQRDATLWMPAAGSFSYTLPGPRTKPERFVGMVRGPISSPEQSTAVFAKVDEEAQADARRRGLLSHQIFIKIGPTREPQELLGLDMWCDFDGMNEHYKDTKHMSALGGAFTDRPDASVWFQAPGEWSEW